MFEKTSIYNHIPQDIGLGSGGGAWPWGTEPPQYFEWGLEYPLAPQKSLYPYKS